MPSVDIGKGSPLENVQYQSQQYLPSPSSASPSTFTLRPDPTEEPDPTTYANDISQEHPLSQGQLNEKDSSPTQFSRQLADQYTLPPVTHTVTAASTAASGLTNLPPAPDGGIQAWTQVLLAWTVVFLTWGYINSFGAFQAHYETVLPEAPSTISWIGSVQVCLTFLIGAFSGRMLDAGYFHPTLLVGGALHLLGVFMMSLSRRYWQLMLTQGVLTGLGNGMIFTPVVGIVSTYFSKRRGLAIGLTTTSSSVGGIVYPIMVRELLPKIGFGWTTRALGLINAVLLTAAMLFLKPRLPPWESGSLFDKTALRDRTWVLYVASMTCYLWSLYFTFYYVAPFGVQELGLSFSESSLVVTIINGVGFPFRVLAPMLADRVGVLNVMVPCLLCLTVVNYCWLAVSTKAGFYTFVVIYGMFGSSFQCLQPTGMASFTKRMDTIGTRLGMMFTAMSIGALTGPPVGGALENVGVGHFKPSQAWSATVMLAGFCFILAARVSKVGWVVNVRA